MSGIIAVFHINPKTLMSIEPKIISSVATNYMKLYDMVNVLRSKDAGIGYVSIDIFFKSSEYFYNACNSNIFTIDGISKLLKIDKKFIVGCYAVKDCNAIKVALLREVLSGDLYGRDLYGCQYHIPLQEWLIPIY